jgi:multiple sugar transport system permease protein
LWRRGKTARHSRLAPPPLPPPPPRPAARRPERRGRAAGLLFVAPYLLLLLAFGVGPTGYALYLSLTNFQGRLVGLGNFTRVFGDFRLAPSFEHIALYLLIWLTVLVALVVGIAIMLHGRLRRISSVARFVYYLPGAMAGAASALLWMFVLDPVVSPAAPVLRLLGFQTFSNVIAPGHLPVVFAVIAFWTGAGGWIVVMHGALNNIPGDVLEAARIDGANSLQLAWHVQVPMLRKWIAYMLILAFATGTQLFVEPQLVGIASLGQVSNSWSPNQLAYQYAFASNDFSAAAAVSVMLLLLGVGCAALVVSKSRLFEVE